MIIKMRKASKRLNELDEESDLRLRQDLIDMESRYESCVSIPITFTADLNSAEAPRLRTSALET